MERKSPTSNLAAGAHQSTLHILTIPTSGSQPLATPSSNPPAGTLVNVPLAAASNARSSPWVDYENDILYVGLDDGHWYKVTGVFKGTPALVSDLSASMTVTSTTPTTRTQPRATCSFVGSAGGIKHGSSPSIFDSPIDATIVSADEKLAGICVEHPGCSKFGQWRYGWAMLQFPVEEK